MEKLRSKAEEYLPQMRHCTRCRADAVGLLDDDRTGEFRSCLTACSSLKPMPAEMRPYVAVATEQGLIVPVIKNADSLNLTGLARAINDLATRSRDRKLKPDEVSGGTFSISNFGVYGTKIGFPLINQPQVAILGVGALKKQAVVINDAIAIRPIMSISLMFDHRLIDGEQGGKFLEAIHRNLVNMEPKSLF